MILFLENVQKRIYNECISQQGLDDQTETYYYMNHDHLFKLSLSHTPCVHA